MSVKRRIFLLNIAMVASTLMILLLITTWFIHHSTGRYEEELNWITDIDSDAVPVWNQILRLENENLSWEELAGQIDEYNYDLIVSQGDTILYQTLEEDVEKYIAVAQTKKQNGIHSAYGVTYVDETVTIDGQDYYIIAIQEISSSNGILSRKNEMNNFLYRLIGLGIITIITLILTSRFFSGRLVNKILEPMELLKKGTKRVASGNFDEQIIYKGDQEFEAVCDTFNLMQEKVRANEEEQKKYEQDRTDMVTSISHDLRTPLTSISGYIKGVLDGVANTKEKQMKYLKIAYDSTEDMDILLQKLFIFSKIETGNMPFDYVRINLAEFIEQYAAQKEAHYMEKGLEIRLRLKENGYEGNYDVVQLKRIFDNLLENSLCYANREHVIVQIQLEETEDEEFLVFKDNGNGVPYDKLPHIFERFYRCDDSRGIKGNGVGLYVVKYIVECHGGTISAENENGLVIRMRFGKRRKASE